VTRDEYVRDVGWWLRDLPWSTRRDLVTELRGHLDELPADTDFRAQLGPPEAYASDLRSAAGLERRRGPIAFLRARRPRNLILAVLGLTLIGLAIGSVVCIDSYQPLAFGNGSQFPAGATGVGGIEGQSVDFHKGRPFVYGMEIMNTGRFTVRVLGVPYESNLPWTARLFMSGPSYTGDYRASTRFHPIDLKHGERVYLVFKGVFACHSGMAKGGALTLEDFPVRFSFLWRKATTMIPLPENLAIVFPKGCPPPAGSPASP
jgi:hypothetical protein